jgi:Cellulase (glycosyl hydrolase family 5).
MKNEYRKWIYRSTIRIVKMGILVMVALPAIVFLSCSSEHEPITQSGNGPRFELYKGENFFRIDGKQAFVLGRNPVGTSAEAYEEHFRNIAANGERIARIHFTYMPTDENPGEISEGMLYVWDQVLDAAEKYGVAVLPVLDVWSNWNNGSGGVPMEWTRWNNNPFEINKKAQSPNDLFNNTPCRNLWLQRLEKFVKHWSNRRAIIGWEIFSELDLVTGATEDQAVPFVERAAEVIRANDPWKRPITASLAGIDDWPRFSKSSALDFLEIHPYASGGFKGQLDSLIISTVRQRLVKYGKPIFIGESGLSASSPHGTLDVATHSNIGIRNAIWASVVSGAMNGRMLWWHDGYDMFEKVDLCCQYQQAAAPSAEFVHAIDFNGFVPISCALSNGLMGAMIGNGKSFLGWFRDVQCVPPNWTINKMVGQTVAVDVSGNLWQVAFFDTTTGEQISERQLTAQAGGIHIVLPEFIGSIAIRLKSLQS